MQATSDVVQQGNSPQPGHSFINLTGITMATRIWNGEDEDTISLMSSMKDASHTLNFLSGILVSPRSTADDILNWKLGLKYYAILQSRIQTHGHILTFEYTFASGRKKMFEQDLREFLVDYKPELGEENSIGMYQAKMYPNGSESQRILTLSSGKVVRYDYLTSKGEKRALLANPDTQSKNQALVVRNLCLSKEGQFVPQVNFRSFSAPEMEEIRKDVKENDPQFEGIMELRGTNPEDIAWVTIFALGEFFFPAGT